MTDHQKEREVAAAAGAEDRRGTDRERIQQRRRVVGLLLRRGRLPAGRGGTAPVTAPVIADDRELVGQRVGERVEVAAVAGRPMITRTGGPVPRTSW